jgi:tRNA (adenine-N(1)-)-methyltransferase non-catalytic subunit
MDTVHAGETILLIFNDGLRFFLEAGRDARVKDGVLPSRALIGAPFGSVWEMVAPRSLVRVASGELTPLSLIASLQTGGSSGGAGEGEGVGGGGGGEEAGGGGGGGAPRRDNRLLVDTGTAQALRDEDIAAMRRRGEAGAEIVRALAGSSATFSDKTAFSQEKYLRKKAHKYVRRFRVCRCTAQSITETLVESAPLRIVGLRVDSLSAMLSHGDVRWGATALVFDGAGGLLVGAVAERMSRAEGAGAGAGGYVIAAHEGGAAPHLPLLQTFNLWRVPGVRRALAAVRYSELTGWAEGIAAEAPAAPPAPSPAEGGADALEGGGEGSGGGGGGGARKRQRGGGEEGAEGGGRALTPWPYSDAARKHLLGRGVDSVLISLPPEVDPETALLAALRYTRPSASLAVFSLHAPPLAALAVRLRDMGLATNLQLAETWTRELQVLPLRTHPHMSMHGASGFVLSGTALAHPWSVVHMALRAPQRRAAAKRGQPPAAAAVAAATKAVAVAAAAASAAASARSPPLPAAATTAAPEDAPGDVALMLRACAEAARCEPSPGAYSVGALVVAPGGEVLASGFSRELPGNTHAEEVALGRCAPGAAAGATVYTSMEPCGRRLSGKEPCVARLVAARVARVVLAVHEPPHFVEDCNGVAALRAAGIVVTVLSSEACRAAALAPNAHVGKQ